MDTTKIAQTLAHLFLHANDERIHSRPIDRKMAGAQVKGAYKIAHAAGYGHTPHHVEMTTLDTFREITAQSPRPLYHAANNRAQQEWDKAFIEALTAALDEIA